MPLKACTENFAVQISFGKPEIECPNKKKID